MNKARDVEAFLEVPESYELLAVIAIGYPKEDGEEKRGGDRKELRDLVFGQWPFD